MYKRQELDFEGYQVETAYDGQEAIEKAQSFEPDLIVLDIMLPKVNGYDVCKTLTPMMDVPIILLTAKTDIIDKVLGLEPVSYTHLDVYKRQMAFLYMRRSHRHIS